MGILWVGISHTIPVPITGTGIYRTIIYAVSDETRSILIIKIIKITIIITLLKYVTKNKRGGIP
jgi:hypothetical protein